MTQHLVVGVYDAESDAAAAVRDLQSADVPAAAIDQHTKASFGGTDFSSANAITHKKGFWGHLFGTTGDEDSEAYNLSIERGSTVVTVRVSEEDVDRVSAILESHGPIDLDDETTSDANPIIANPSDANAGADNPGDANPIRVRRYVVETIVHEPRKY